ncbi:MAG: hypothetical protein Q7S40_21870 [Opitutaceae bacterium]|nr:hypothetical protein [Opitutaceae bacterium]
MSDSPHKKHPWSKYYSQRGVSRPGIADLVRPVPAPTPAGSNKPDRPAPAKPDLSDELAAAVAAATGDLTGTTAAPFITMMQREAVTRELRSQARRRWLGRGVVALVALVVVHFATTRFFYRAPTAAALQAYAAVLGRTVLPLHSGTLQPLRLGGVTMAMTDRVSSSRIRYAAEVTLRLEQPLYVPAITNGTALYRQMQQSAQAARDLDLKLKLFEGKDGPGFPELPLLIQISHRAGEKLVVRVPFEAHRFGWHWRIEPAQLALRSSDRTFDGATIERYAAAPHLVFGSASTFADIRRRTVLARAYVIAVAKEVQKSADAEAVGVPLVDPALANLPALDANTPAIDPLADRPAVPVGAGGADPNAPAVDPNAPPASADLPQRMDPDAPAFDPNAPAVIDTTATKTAQPPSPRVPRQP